jgi:hypothetical protein
LGIRGRKRKRREGGEEIKGRGEEGGEEGGRRGDKRKRRGGREEGREKRERKGSVESTNQLKAVNFRAAFSQNDVMNNTL